MTRNQKIALGCGGAGCLGIIVVAIAGCLFYFFTRPAYRAARDYNFNVNLNGNLNSNSNSNTNSENANSTPNVNASSNSSSGSSLSNDDKHKLFQAASMTGDAELIRRVNVKIGLVNEDFTPSADYDRFVGEHISWAMQNVDFMQSISTPAKARAYVNDHFPN